MVVVVLLVVVAMLVAFVMMVVMVLVLRARTGDPRLHVLLVNGWTGSPDTSIDANSGAAA